MRAAYVDTSFLLAIVFAEPRSQTLRRVLRRFAQLFSSDLLVAEALSAAEREGVETAVVAPAIESISLVLPPRTLEPEAREALTHGHIRGADLWHVACAMFLAGRERSEVAFLSRDVAQRKLAGRLGFPTP